MLITLKSNTIRSRFILPELYFGVKGISCNNCITLCRYRGTQPIPIIVIASKNTILLTANPKSQMFPFGWPSLNLGTEIDLTQVSPPSAFSGSVSWQSCAERTGKERGQHLDLLTGFSNKIRNVYSRLGFSEMLSCHSIHFFHIPPGRITIQTPKRVLILFSLWRIFAHLKQGEFKVRSLGVKECFW